MVEFIKMRPQTVSFVGARNDLSVKLEIAAEHDDDHGHVSKRSRLSPSTFIQWSPGNNEFPATPSQCNLLDEPSPLGLSLRKSPSLLDLIQMKLLQSNASALAAV
ncbi:hypothetical protein ACH5RR_006506 [Cinchona calisaya]|uniref:Uncharacterized protein n=1 Tax=Cinchona calisaya TaxID=153742 RepID=A0ABD3AP71_9GENT